jgi:predicted enzyme related to lactoylglutathione lyase
MPVRDTAPAGAPCWVDLLTSDSARSRGFYSELFGWTAEEPSEEYGGYFMFTRNGVPVAGGMPSQPGMGMPDAWSVYLATGDARKTADTAAAHGGQIIAPAMDVADLGTMAVVADPGGAGIGMWQPREFHGLRVLGEPGTPGWFELLTRDYRRAVSFYREVFRWDTHVVSDTPEFRYTILRHGEEMLAGIMDASGFLPEGVRPHWSVYFSVEDTDAALASISRLGGSTTQAAEDTPYGRLAGAADPTGARFKLVSPNAGAGSSPAPA